MRYYRVMPSHSQRRLRLSTLLAVVGLCSLLALPALGSQLYFRHDDASFVLLSARFHGSWLAVFSTDPDVNTWGTLGGLSGYYRPTAYLLALGLIRTFNANAAVLMALAGAAMAGAIALFYVAARAVADPRRATIALYVALFAGTTLLYQSFRLVVPWGYLEIMAALACMLAGAQRRSTALILLGGLFWVLSSSRQSALLLVPLVVVTALATVPSLTKAWPSPAAALRRFALLLGPFALAIAVMLIVGGLSRGSGGMSADPAYLAQRYRFYADTLFGGPRALLLVPVFYNALLLRRRPVGNGRSVAAGLSLSVLALSCAATVIVGLVSALGPLALLVAGALGARRDRTLLVGVVWFCVGFSIYLVPAYYHQAYSLEAFLGLALTTACCTPLLARDLWATATSLWSAGRMVRGVMLTGAVIALVLCAVGGLATGPRAFASARAAVTGLVDNNRTFQQSVAYLSALDTGGDATVLAFSNRQRGLSNADWRSRGLTYRATVVPVMDLPEIQDLLDALRGPGLTFVPYGRPGHVSVPADRPLYGLAFGEAEAEEMAQSWAATEVAHIANGDATTTIFRLRAPKP